MDPLALAERAYGVAERTISGVRPEQLDGPTPCTEWDVRTLVNHMIGGHYFFTAAVTGQQMDPNATPPDFAGTDPVGSFVVGSKGMLEAWCGPGALDRTVPTPMGAMPASSLLGLHAMDNVVHSWDLARATGQDENLDAELSTTILAYMKENAYPRSDEPGAVFRPEKAAPPGANPTQQLAAFLGRTV